MALTPEQEAFVVELFDAHQATVAAAENFEAWRQRVIARKARLEDPNDNYTVEDYEADLAADPQPPEVPA